MSATSPKENPPPSFDYSINYIELNLLSFFGWWIEGGNSISNEGLSDFVNGDDSDKIEGFLKNFANGLTKNDSWFHVLISDNSVFFVVFLNFHAYFVDEVGYLVDSELLSRIS